MSDYKPDVVYPDNQIKKQWLYPGAQLFLQIYFAQLNMPGQSPEVAHGDNHYLGW